MTQEEKDKLHKAANEYANSIAQHDERKTYCSEDFIAGAKWSYNMMINKACEWLKENKDHPLIGCEDPCLSGYLTDEFIEHFKKTMEE